MSASGSPLTDVQKSGGSANSSTPAAAPATTGAVMPWHRIAALQQQWDLAKATMADIEVQLEAVIAVAHEEQSKHAAEIEEYEAVRAQVEAVEERIRQVHQITQRYSTVEDPVIASDGFTYERRTILSYFEECRLTDVAPRSNQTDTTLTHELMSNSTLRRIVDQLRAVRLPGDPAPPPVQPAVQQPQMPQQMPRAPVPAFVQPVAFRPQQAFAPPVRTTPVLPPAYTRTLGAMPSAPVRPQLPVSYGAAPQPQVQPAPTHMPPPSFQASQLGAAPPSQAAFTVTNPSPGQALSGLTHPCLRVYGSCNFAGDCTWARYPLECCLSHLKGRCRYGNQCKELHVEPLGVQPTPVTQSAAPSWGSNQQYF